MPYSNFKWNILHFIKTLCIIVRSKQYYNINLPFSEMSFPACRSVFYTGVTMSFLFVLLINKHKIKTSLEKNGGNKRDIKSVNLIISDDRYLKRAEPEMNRFRQCLQCQIFIFLSGWSPWKVRRWLHAIGRWINALWNVRCLHVHVLSENIQQSIIKLSAVVG